MYLTFMYASSIITRFMFYQTQIDMNTKEYIVSWPRKKFLLEVEWKLSKIESPFIIAKRV